MTTYRTKPLLVEAWQFNGEDRFQWPSWLKGHPDTYYQLHPDDGLVGCICWDGGIAHRGTWVIRGVDGGLSTCSPGVFAVTYEMERTGA